MNKRLRKLQDEKAAVAVEKKVRKPRAKKTPEPVYVAPEQHNHCIQLNTPATPQPLRDFHYFKSMNKAARRENGKVIELTSDIKGI